MKTSSSWLFSVGVFAALALTSGSRLHAGSYRITNCGASLNCQLLVDPKRVPTPNSLILPGAIVHPLGYGPSHKTAGGTVTIRVCTDDPYLVESLQWAISKWQDLVPATENCVGCWVWEEPPPAVGRFDAKSLFLHELGHCAYGLDHINREWNFDTGDPLYAFSSVAVSASVPPVACAIIGDRVPDAASDPPGYCDALQLINGVRVPCGAGCDSTDDGIRGSGDDFHDKAGGGVNPADSLSWHRKEDNDPFVLDAVVIDKDTYTRDVVNPPSGPPNLPTGDRWGATANYKVSEALNGTHTQSVMYAGIALEEIFTDLSADDVNMVKMGMTGFNADDENGAGDDYDVDLTFVGSCTATHDVRAVRLHLPVNVGECRNTGIAQSYAPANASIPVHYSVVRVGGAPTIVVNENLTFAYGEDLDDDSVPDSVEDGAPNGGDGDLSGVDDRFEPNVASFPSRVDGEYITLVSPPETFLVDVVAINPAQFGLYGLIPAGVRPILGFISFRVLNVPSGGTITVTLRHQMGTTPTSYWVHGAETSGSMAHWYPFQFDGTTGAQLQNGVVTLTLTDGNGRGDDDFEVNGEIVDPSGPVAPLPALDIDGNGQGLDPNISTPTFLQPMPLTDGLLVLRYLFGFTGATLTNGAVGSSCFRCDADAIEPYLGDLVANGVLDIDDNGEFGALSDGLLALRYLFGFTGATLINGAVGGGCNRCDAPSIEAYLATLVH